MFKYHLKKFVTISGANCFLARRKERTGKPEARSSPQNQNVRICPETRKVSQKVFVPTKVSEVNKNFTTVSDCGDKNVEFLS